VGHISTWALSEPPIFVLSHFDEYCNYSYKFEFKKNSKQATTNIWLISYNEFCIVDSKGRNDTLGFFLNKIFCMKASTKWILIGHQFSHSQWKNLQSQCHDIRSQRYM